MTPTIRRTFGNGGFGAAVSPQSLGKPAAIYPGAVATDSDMMIAVDRQQTTLLLPLNATDTTMTVLSTSGIVSYNLLSIDNEIVKTTGTPTGNVVPISRGFDGTTPAAHLSNATVAGLIDAYHHNRLVAEVEAIEQALGPNLSRIPTALPFLVATSFLFTPQTPGGTLNPGSNVINLSPVPVGVNGSNTNHFLYISGGTGAAERVLITGGTAVSGAASGTVIVTCANTHSGAWTISSATAGGQEAYWSNGGTGRVHIMWPSGSFQFHAPIRVAADAVWFSGQGPTATAVGYGGAADANLNIFEFQGAGVQASGLSDLYLGGEASSTTGSAIAAVGQTYFAAERLLIQNCANGISDTDGVSNVYRDVFIRNLKGDGVFLTGPSSNIVVLDNVQTVSSTAYDNGLHIPQGGNIIIVSCSFLGGNYGLLLDPASGKVVASVDVMGTYFDQCAGAGIRIAPGAGGAVTRCRVLQGWTFGGGTGIHLAATGGQILGVMFDQMFICGNAGNGVEIDAGQDVSVRNSTISNNGSASGVAVASGLDSIQITGNKIGNGLAGLTGGSQAFGINLAGTAPHLSIVGNTFVANTIGPIGYAPNTLSSAVIRDNTGVDDVIPSVASAATIVLTPEPSQKITGTTTITTLQGAWRGRVLTLIKTDAGSVTIGGGGNIPATHTLAQNGSLALSYDGTFWY